MKTTINLDFRFMAHRIFLNLRIAKRQQKPGYAFAKTKRNLKHEKQPLAASNYSRRHERLLRCRRTTKQ